jgi:hypothetical protein
MDLTGDKLRHALPGSRSFLPTIVEDCQCFYRTPFKLACLDGMAQVVGPKLCKVFVAIDVDRFDANGVDGNIGEYFLPRHIHNFLEPPHQVNYFTFIAIKKNFGKFQHGQERDLAVEIATSGALM